MNIRPVQQADLPAWAELRALLWPDSQDQHEKELEAFFAGTSIDIVEALVLVSETGEVCGFMELNIRNFAEGSRCSKVPYVEAWYVKPNYQDAGYGKQFMQLAEAWAKKLGYSELASDTEIVNEKSIAIHKKLGFTETERIVCFLKKL